jgi:hypothetical protein
VSLFDWKADMPHVSVDSNCIDIKRRSGTQKHVLFRAVDPITVTNMDNGEKLELPAGTLSDGSSVPGALWGALDAEPPDLLLPGFAHDYLYRSGSRIKRPDGTLRTFDRYEADLYHVAICRLLKVNAGDRAKIFYALRVGGAFVFGQRNVGWDGQE